MSTSRGEDDEVEVEVEVEGIPDPGLVDVDVVVAVVDDEDNVVRVVLAGRAGAELASVSSMTDCEASVMPRCARSGESSMARTVALS